MDEIARNQQFYKILNTLRNIENDYALLLSTGQANLQGAGNGSGIGMGANRTQTGFHKPQKIE